MLFQVSCCYRCSWIVPLLLSVFLTGSEAQQEICSLWLAPSYTGTEHRPKYGMYAGHNFSRDSILPLPELAIPLIDTQAVFSNERELFGDQNQTRNSILDFLESHLWTSDQAGTTWEGMFPAPLVIPGIGSLPKRHTGLINVDFNKPSVYFREKTKVPKAGKPFPNRGANTLYHNVTLRAITDIPAGMELFADFGQSWDDKGDDSDDIFQDTIRRNDYVLADKVLHALVSLYDDFPDLPLGLQDELLDFVLQDVLGTAVGKRARTIRSILPDNPRKLKSVVEAGGTFLYRYSDMIRSSEWLSRHGYCMDTLRQGPSKIPLAGRGAFLTRPVPANDVITVTPMLHIADKDLLTMYPLREAIHPETGRKIVVYQRQSQPTGQQLLLNYCFGHPESSLLLFPLASQVTLINHNAVTPNAMVTWARVKDNGLSNQHMYQDYTVEQLSQVTDIVMVLKIVALRDLLPGEEVTIDYGPEWSSAWKEYLENWQDQVTRTPHPIQAEDVRQEYKIKPLETQETLLVQSYPPNVAPACFLPTRPRPDGVAHHDGSHPIVEWFQDPTQEPYRGEDFKVVDILERVPHADDFYHYTVLARAPFSPSGIHRVVHVPHAACTFVNRPYTSDQHLPGAFRHAIGFPDTAFPQAWRNLR
eukprot:Nitzschia sp. Nitz4//scaffold27_size158506//35282//37299//NITZ4_002586-RA/size158506-snap-gene-0.210-mRNA-1//-1//CDS//3329545446//4728//frame0